MRERACRISAAVGERIYAYSWGRVHKFTVKRMGWPEPSHSSSKQILVLEDEPDDKLNHTSALLFGGSAEVRVGLRKVARSILLELECQVVVVGE